MIIAHMDVAGPAAGGGPSMQAVLTAGAVAAVIALGAVAFLLAWLDRRSVLGAPNREVASERVSALLAAGLSVGAGVIHLAVTGSHLESSPLQGVAFAAVTLFQLAWAGGFLVRPGVRLAQSAIVVNVLVIGGWVLSRTVGLPIAEVPWRPESVGVADLVASALEVALVAALAGYLRRVPEVPGTLRRVALRAAVAHNGMVLTGVAVIVSTALFAGGA